MRDVIKFESQQSLRMTCKNKKSKKVFLQPFVNIFIFLSLFALPSSIYAQSYFKDVKDLDVEKHPFLLDESNWKFHSGAHLRTSYNLVNNTVDLDLANNNDKTSYLGLAYDFTFDLRHLSGLEFYSFVERRGRADYDAPLYGSRGINSLFGRYHWYQNSDLYPRLRETWLEVPVNSTKDVNFKFGLYPYGRDLGHNIALGGKYENYGLTLSGVNESLDWNVHWEKEDLNNRIHLGKVIDHEKVNDWNDTNAYFYTADTTFKLGKQRLQLYTGWLRDRTPEGARASRFSTRVKNEDLVTPGAYLKLNFDRLNLGFEGDQNLGKAKAINTAQNDIEHKGYLLVADASYDLGAFKPKTKFFMASGNRFNAQNYNELTLTSNENEAFSVFSPLNTNLTDTHYQKQFGPYVAMAGGYAVNFGVARPGTFGDPFMFENLIASTVGFDYTPLEKWYIGVDYWYLRSKEPGWGLDGNGNLKTFSKDLGQELDVFASYQITKAIKFSILSGYFFPGDYYKETRADTAANNIFAPTPRRDGEADGAYQVEFGLDIEF